MAPTGCREGTRSPAPGKSCSLGRRAACLQCAPCQPLQAGSLPCSQTLWLGLARELAPARTLALLLPARRLALLLPVRTLALPLPVHTLALLEPVRTLALRRRVEHEQLAQPRRLPLRSHQRHPQSAKLRMPLVRKTAAAVLFVIATATAAAALPEASALPNLVLSCRPRSHCSRCCHTLLLASRAARWKTPSSSASAAVGWY